MKNDQNLISKISAWQYAPGNGNGNGNGNGGGNGGGAGKNRTPRWQPEKLQP